jgi:hypothetical protein
VPSWERPVTLGYGELRSLPRLEWDVAGNGDTYSRFTWEDEATGRALQVEAIASVDGWYIEIGDFMLGGNAVSLEHAKHMAAVAFRVLAEQGSRMDADSERWLDDRRAPRSVH